MDKKFFEKWDPNYNRTVFNLILNGTNKGEASRLHNREFSKCDFFPTILSSMGVKLEKNRLGLGTDLFSTKPTLIEEHGLAKHEKELGSLSKFYNLEFVSERNGSKPKNS